MICNISFHRLMLLTIILLLLTGCSADQITRPVKTGPTIMYISPQSGAKRVNVSSNITITFSEPIDPATVSSETIRIVPLLKGKYRFNGNKLTINLTRIMSHDTKYTVTVTTGVHNTHGEQLDHTYTWSFITRQRPPSIYKISPLVGRINEEITIKGARFSSSPSGNSVHFNNVSAKVLAAEPTRLVVRVPIGAKSGYITVSTQGGRTIAPHQFKVVRPGLFWEQVFSGTDKSILSVAWSGSHYIAVGQAGTILMSHDGLTWTPILSGTNSCLERVRWTGSRFIAVGSGGTILTSGYGYSWTQRESGTNTNLMDLAISPGRYMTVGANGVTLYSDNGKGWSPRRSTISDWLYGIAVFNSSFIAVGYNGTVIVSHRNSSWINVNPITNRHLLAVTASDTAIYAAGYYGTIITSTNFRDWREVNSGTSHHLGSIVYYNNELFALGEQGTIISSLDGIHWEQRDCPVNESLNDIAWSGRELVAVGDHGTILISY